MRYLSLVLGIVMCLEGCASAGASRSSGRDIITQEDLANTVAITAYDAIRDLHPQWLRARGQTTGATSLTPLTASVFLDGTKMGNLDILGIYQVSDIKEIRYLDAGRAATRYGMGYPRGIIEIISIR
jgi:hypothetical protein